MGQDDLNRAREVQLYLWLVTLKPEHPARVPAARGYDEHHGRVRDKSLAIHARNCVGFALKGDALWITHEIRRSDRLSRVV